VVGGTGVVTGCDVVLVDVCGLVVVLFTVIVVVVVLVVITL
jgi:hypothetical protein